PLDRGRWLARAAPLNQDAPVGFDRLDDHVQAESVHLPIPSRGLARRELVAAAAKPEFRRDGGIDERLEYLRNRSSDQHLRFGAQHDVPPFMMNVAPEGLGDEGSVFAKRRGLLYA